MVITSLWLWVNSERFYEVVSLYDAEESTGDVAFSSGQNKLICYNSSIGTGILDVVEVYKKVGSNYEILSDQYYDYLIYNYNPMVLYDGRNCHNEQNGYCACC